MTFITEFIIGILLQLYSFTGSLGWAIILFTVLIRSALVPLTFKSLKAANQIKSIQPELKKLREKHKNNKESRQQAELELYKKYNINPVAGCLPQVIQIALLIVLYQVLIKVLGNGGAHEVVFNTKFFWLDLSQPDKLYVLPVLAAATQLFLSLMILPGGETPDIIPNKSSKKAVQEANKKEEDMAEMAASMQKQMLFIMPLMTGFIALRFPSGLALYWVITTVFSIVQQWVVSGPGGLITYSQRAVAYIKKSMPSERKS